MAHVKMRDDDGKLYDIHPDEVANSPHLTRVVAAAALKAEVVEQVDAPKADEPQARKAKG